MGFFSRLVTTGRYYRNVSFLAIPTGLGIGTWQHLERKKLLESYHVDHQKETLTELESTPKHVFRRGVAVGVLWPLLPFWTLFEMNKTEELSNLTEEQLDQTVLKNHMVQQLRNIPLDHTQKLSEYLLKHEKNSDDCPFDIPVSENNWLTEAGEVIRSVTNFI